MKKSNKVILLVLAILILPAAAAAYTYFANLFAPRVFYQTDKEPLDVVAGDINADGLIDILTANREGRSISIFTGNGDGTLTPISSISTELGATSLTLADFNSDEHADIAVTVCNYGCTKNAIKIYHGSGNGEFQEAMFIEASGVPYNIETGDFDADNIIDFAASDASEHRIQLYLSAGNHEHYETKFLPTGERPIAFAVGDLNNDNIPDLVTSNQWGRNSTTYLSLGNGEFSEPYTLELGELPYSISLAHLDHDLFLDLLVAYSQDPGLVALYRGLGDGNFELMNDFDVDDRLVYIHTADFNHDEAPDIVVTRNTRTYASIFYNIQKHSFDFDEQEIRIPAENKIFSLAVTHLNDDWYPDLVTVDFEQSNVSVSLGQEPE